MIWATNQEYQELKKSWKNWQINIIEAKEYSSIGQRMKLIGNTSFCQIQKLRVIQNIQSWAMKGKEFQRKLETILYANHKIIYHFLAA